MCDELDHKERNCFYCGIDGSTVKYLYQSRINGGAWMCEFCKDVTEKVKGPLTSAILLSIVARSHNIIMKKLEALSRK